MVYQSGKMTLNSVMKVFKGKVNDVEICESVENGRSTYYTVLIVKDHETVRKLLGVLEACPYGNECYVDMFSDGNGFYIVFDYVKERKLDTFFMASNMSLETCNDICLNLVVQCMTSKLPYPLLELVIEQRQFELMQDNSIALGYSIDLEKLDPDCGETGCVIKTALVVRDLLESKMTRKNVGYNLLARKIPRNSYKDYRELYKDIKLATSTGAKRNLLASIRHFFRKRDRLIFRIVLIICIVLAILALLVFISKLVWGDIPFMRLFYNTIKKIGTESLID